MRKHRSIKFEFLDAGWPQQTLQVMHDIHPSVTCQWIVSNKWKGCPKSYRQCVKGQEPNPAPSVSVMRSRRRLLDDILSRDHAPAGNYTDSWTEDASLRKRQRRPRDATEIHVTVHLLDSPPTALGCSAVQCHSRLLLDRTGARPTNQGFPSSQNTVR